MSDNLVKKHLKKLELISSDQFIGSTFVDNDEWEIYKISNNTLFYVFFELTGSLGYAFCVKITCKKMTNNIETFYHVKSYGNEVKEDWDCEQYIKDRLMSNAIAILKPY